MAADTRGHRAHVDRRLRAFRPGPELAGAFQRLARRLRLFDPGYFTHPRALPVVDLPAWVGAWLRRTGRGLPRATVLAAAEAAAFGYLHARVLDDWFDEGTGEPGEVMLLASALLTRHQALLAAVAGDDARFWALFESAWSAHQEALGFERALAKQGTGCDRDAFERVLGFSRPLSLPAQALLHRAAGTPKEIARLERLVRRLAAGHQRFVDVLDWHEDRTLDRPTHALFRCPTPRALLVEGGLDALLDEARGDLDQVRRGAEALGLDEMVTFTGARVRFMEETRQAVFAALFSALSVPGKPVL